MRVDPDMADACRCLAACSLGRSPKRRVAQRIVVWLVLWPALCHAQSTPLPHETDAAGTLRSAVPAKRPTERRPPLKYLGRTIAQTMHYTGADWLVRESREREEDCATMLRELKLKAGMTVCDMGCGNGFYALQIAELLGDEGTVLAVDIQSEMLRLLQARAAHKNFKNIRTILGIPTNPKLEPATVDLILCVDVYHEFSHPREMLTAMRKALSPTGALVLVEFRAEDPEVPIKPLHKMSKRQINKEMKANQFRLVREFDGLPWQHMMFFAPVETDDNR